MTNVFAVMMLIAPTAALVAAFAVLAARERRARGQPAAEPVE